MAITILPKGESLGEVLGTGLGSGLSKGIQMMAEQKMEGLQKRNLLSTLIGANVPENVATAIANAPKSLQREMFKPLMRLDKSLTEERDKRGNISDLHNLRKQLLKNVKSGELEEGAVREELTQGGVAPEEINILLGGELDDSIVRYFLDKTNNDPKKARALAKKFGYKV